MAGGGVDPLMLEAWLSARSVVRGLPAPVAEHGGFRVETGADAEVRRWVFPRLGPGLVALARGVRSPLQPVKLCGTAAELRSALPHGWSLHPGAHFMRGSGAPPRRPAPAGYRIEIEACGPVTEVRMWSDGGELAASGYAAEVHGVFIYDRIVTAPAHRRKGLGHAVMAALRHARQHDASTELLVATDAGRALYATLGWRTISPCSTALFADAAAPDQNFTATRA